MKRLITVFGIVVLVGAVALPVLAHGPRGGRWGRHMMGNWGGGSGSHMGYDRGYVNLTEEQQNQLGKAHQGFYDETSELRNDIRAKRAELNALLNSSDPDAEQAKALQKEISDLRAKLAQERINFALEERKINPDARIGRGYGRGYGAHMGGYGPGMGSHMMGYGPGMGYGSGMGYGPGMGYGSHMGGYGAQMGYGPGMGYGQGNCWN